MKTVFRMLGTVMFLISLLLHASESKTGYVDGDNPNAEVTFSTEYATSYTISASPTGGWVFTDDFGVSGYSGWYKSAAHSAKCEKLVINDIQIATVWVDAATAFGVTINGKMYKPGGPNGSLVNWSVAGKSNAATISMHLDPSEAIVALGDSKGFTYKKADDVALYGLWWDSSKTPSFDTGNYSAIGSTYNFSSTTAGQYTLTAARNGAGHKSASATVKNVEAASISVSGATQIGTTKDWVVAKGTGNVTITATLNPAIAEVDIPAGLITWTGGTAVANHPLQRTVSKGTAAKTTVKITCGTSSKEVDIWVIEVQSLTRANTNTSRRLATGVPITVPVSHWSNTITVVTNPVGREDCVTLTVPTGKGSITRDTSNPAKWDYAAPVEAKSNVGVTKVDSFNVSSSILGVASTKTASIHLCSVFHYLGTLDNDRDKALVYAIWKYNISTANMTSIGYDSTLTTAGLAPPGDNVSIGPDAFTSEWFCASVVGHENVHCDQLWTTRATSAGEREAYQWELDHSNAPGYTASPVTYIYTYAKPDYDDAKSNYVSNGGTTTYP